MIHDHFDGTSLLLNDCYRRVSSSSPFFFPAFLISCSDLITGYLFTPPLPYPESISIPSLPWPANASRKALSHRVNPPSRPMVRFPLRLDPKLLRSLHHPRTLASSRMFQSQYSSFASRMMVRHQTKNPTFVCHLRSTLICCDSQSQLGHAHRTLVPSSRIFHSRDKLLSAKSFMHIHFLRIPLSPSKLI